MRHKIKRKLLLVWTLTTLIMLLFALLRGVQFPIIYTIEQRTDCVLLSNMVNQSQVAGRLQLPVYSKTTAWYSHRVLPVLEIRQNYVVISNYIPANNMYEGKETVTLTTQGTYEFLHHVVELCRRWNAPLSVAVYSPGTDFDLAVTQILRMRRCKHPCIKSNVTWHLIYDINHPPSQISLFLSEREREIDCSRSPNQTSSYKMTHLLTYPINVARNVARLQARTHYVFASDIELYPSLNIATNFLKLIKNQTMLTRNVFVLPVFEVEAGLEPPGNKTTLVSMLSKRQAVFFHRHVCDICHRFPRRSEWLKALSKKNGLNVFEVTKRNESWEPFYIGTNDEPLFDERFTWEGKMNKMPQVYEMCLLNYDFSILDNAFLVHAPGIKKYSARGERWRASYARENNKIFRKLTRDLRQKYNVSYLC